MITLEKLRIYKKYDGNDDFYSRSPKDQELFNNDNHNDWHDLMLFVQDHKLIKEGLASESYKNNALIKMKNRFEEVAFKEFTKDLI